MFGFLKKKIDEFTDKVTKKTEEKTIPEKTLEEETPKVVEKINSPEEAQEITGEKIIIKKETPAQENLINEEPDKELVVKKTVAKPKKTKKDFEVKEKKANLGLFSKLKKQVMKEITLSEEEINDFVWELELALLEADVSHDVAQKICEELKEKLSETKFGKKEDIEIKIKDSLKESIKDILEVSDFDFIQKVKENNPCVIMILGPNGAGKTTTIAKLITMLKKEGYTSILAAADTFRAASIEQLEEHANNLGVRVIKQSYGADPAAVAFDAIKSAEANGINCVLIDTAGRQDTNKNLIEELKKINRVAKPHIKIYLDEALAGNAMLDRAKVFKEAIGIDGIILSKMDVDVKGGGAISVAQETNTPIIYFGVGQNYEDLIPFSSEEVIKRIFEE